MIIRVLILSATLVVEHGYGRVTGYRPSDVHALPARAPARCVPCGVETRSGRIITGVIQSAMFRPVMISTHQLASSPCSVQRAWPRCNHPGCRIQPYLQYFPSANLPRSPTTAVLYPTVDTPALGPVVGICPTTTLGSPILSFTTPLPLRLAQLSCCKPSLLSSPSPCLHSHLVSCLYIHLCLLVHFVHLVCHLFRHLLICLVCLVWYLVIRLEPSPRSHYSVWML